MKRGMTLQMELRRIKKYVEDRTGGEESLVSAAPSLRLLMETRRGPVLKKEILGRIEKGVPV